MILSNRILHMSLSRIISSYFFFFFQAEDGIRDDLVTGVQTCALPIFRPHTRLDELKIIDDQKTDTEFPFQTAGFGLQIKDRDGGRIVDEKFSLIKLARDIDQTTPVMVTQITRAGFFKVDAGHGTKKTQRQL